MRLGSKGIIPIAAAVILGIGGAAMLVAGPALIVYSSSIRGAADSKRCNQQQQQQTGQAKSTKSVSSQDIEKLVKDNDGFSASVQDMKGKTVGEYKGDAATYPASTIKPVIAYGALQSGVKLDDKVKLTSEMLYGDGGSAGQEVTVREALDKSLHDSNNTMTNAIIKSAGGPEKLTEKLHSLGYKDTNLKHYYDPSKRENRSSALDTGKGMADIFSGKGEAYTQAQESLKKNAKQKNGNDYFGNPVFAAKAGVIENVTANTAITEKIDGERYIITVYTHLADGGKKVKAIHSGLVDLLGKTGTGEQPADTTSGTQPSDCPEPASGGGTTGAHGTGAEIVKIMQGELGTKEKPPGSDCTKYGPCNPWCGYFAAWVWKKAGIDVKQDDLASVPSIPAWAKKEGRWKPGATNDPQPGDLIVYTGHHVGIVEKVDGKRVTVISGNTIGSGGGDANVVARRVLPDVTKVTAPAPVEGYVSWEKK